MSVYFKPQRNRWCVKWRGKTKNFLTYEEAVAYDEKVKLECAETGLSGTRKQAEVRGETTYTGKPCGVCGCVVKFTCNRKCIACVSSRQKRIHSSKPKWAGVKQIAVVYEMANKLGMEVDHIVPLSGDLVCGLHVWENLQLLVREDNRKKSNLYWPDMP